MRLQSHCADRVAQREATKMYSYSVSATLRKHDIHLLAANGHSRYSVYKLLT